MNLSKHKWEQEMSLVWGITRPASKIMVDKLYTHAKHSSGIKEVNEKKEKGTQNQQCCMKSL